MDIPSSKCEVVKQIECRVLQLFHFKLCYDDQGNKSAEGYPLIRITFVESQNLFGIEDTLKSNILRKTKVQYIDDDDDDSCFTRITHESSKAYFQWGPWDLRFYVVSERPACHRDRSPYLLLTRRVRRPQRY